MPSTLLSAIISQDWRGIILTALFASSILYYFFVHQHNGTRSNKNDNKIIIISDDERRQRREYLANIAEKRAKRMAAAEAAAAAVETITSSGSDSHGKKNKKSAPVNITNTRKNSQTPNKKNNADSAAAPKIDSCKETVLDDKNEVHKNGVTNIGPPNNCARGSLTEQRENLKEKSNEMKQHSSQQHNARENIENNTDERPATVPFIGENKDEAITKVSTQEQKQQQEVSNNSTLTLYLIKSTSPRIQVTIPKNASASKLRQIVSNATNIPSSGLRLIFRGRMIVEERKGGANVNDVVTEFGIEDGCALHVIGKSNYNEPGDVSSFHESLPAPAQQQQTQQESLSLETAATAEQGIIREIQRGLQMNPNYFHHLAAVGNYEILQLVIHNGSFSAEINRADENDWTPLHEAIRGGHKEVVTLLLDEGGLDMHAITNQGHGYSPISLSVHYHGENHPLTRMLRDREETMRVGGGDA